MRVVHRVFGPVSLAAGGARWLVSHLSKGEQNAKAQKFLRINRFERET